MAVDAFGQKNNFPEFTFSKKYNTLISEKDDILLAKPQTFMNDSGIAVKKIVSNSNDHMIVVIHDDIDLPIGKLKISKDSGSGGHKGVESIINNLGTKDFVRFKIGICPEKGKPTAVESFVIKKFTKEELVTIQSTVEKVSESLDFFINNGLEKTMNEYNR